MVRTNLVVFTNLCQFFKNVVSCSCILTYGIETSRDSVHFSPTLKRDDVGVDNSNEKGLVAAAINPYLRQSNINHVMSVNRPCNLSDTNIEKQKLTASMLEARE